MCTPNLEKVAGCLFESEFQYKCWLEKLANETKDDDLVNYSRIAASGISGTSGLNLAFDLSYMCYHTICALGFSLTTGKSPLRYCTTTRNIGVTLSEFSRHLSGTLVGSIVGIASPETAVKWFLPCDQAIMETRKENITTTQLDSLFRMTDIAHQLFEKNDIQYCMTSGTQLGSTRHGGFIAWDDDVDFFVLSQFKQKILKLRSKLSEHGIGIIEFPWGLKLFDLQGKDLEEHGDGVSYKYKYPFIDLFMVAEDKDGHITFENKGYGINYPGEFLTVQEWENRTLQTFGPLQLYGAPEPETYCKRMFGDNVFEYGYQFRNHIEGKMVIPKKFYLRKEEATGKCKPAFTNYVSQDLEVIAKFQFGSQSGFKIPI